MKKDTNNNIEVLARLLEQLYHQWKALPMSIAIIQDNASRACKHQKSLNGLSVWWPWGCARALFFATLRRATPMGP
eukprot:7117225-Lingulodinium_polyedra.AAC.1